MPLVHYSTDRLALGPNSGMPTKHVQFKVYAKIVPNHVNGARSAYIKDGERISRFIENDLENVNFNIAKPVSFTVQVGQSPARVTIYGFLELNRTTSPNVNPTTYPHIIHSGTYPGEPTAVRSGPTGGSTSWGQDVLTRIDSEVYALKTQLETTSSWLSDIFYIEYDGVKYGAIFKRRFRSFPTK